MSHLGAPCICKPRKSLWEITLAPPTRRKEQVFFTPSVHRRNKLFSSCSEQSVWKDRRMEMWKSVLCLLGRWTLWLRRRFLPPYALRSSSEILLLWKVLFTARRRDLSASQIQFYRQLWVRVEPAHWTLYFRRKWCRWQPVLLSRGVAVFLFQLILLAGVWLRS